MRPKPKIIDAHVHLDDRIEGPAINAVSELDQALEKTGVLRALLLQLDIHRWSAKEVGEAVSQSERIVAFINVHPYAPDAAQQLTDGIEKFGFIGLKLHPRFQNFDIADQRTASLVRHAGEIGVPVLIDAFPDGDWLMANFDPKAFASLAKACPSTRIIFAHFGGHHCIDMMMLAKRVPNMYFNLSYSWLYYRGSSVPTDLAYCCRSMRYERIFFGTDYPDRPMDVSIRDSLSLFEKEGITDDDLDRLIFSNARDFFGWNDL
ncbi:MAG: amidohydrolase family protein [Alphaproteobacteria bacterium]|uniref:amidohydrolase family protein n=1 Tax=Alphaproteobacteria TaxID=28211 RepID=UPI00326416A8